MTAADGFIAWLGQSTPTPPIAAPAPSPTPPPPTAAPVPRDRVAEYILKANAAAAARSNPLQSDRDPNDQPPAPTGDQVGDYLARQRWEATRRPNPVRP
jgi:hypothetical protein